MFNKRLRRGNSFTIGEAVTLPNRRPPVSLRSGDRAGTLPDALFHSRTERHANVHSSFAPNPRDRTGGATLGLGRKLFPFNCCPGSGALWASVPFCAVVERFGRPLPVGTPPRREGDPLVQFSAWTPDVALIASCSSLPP